MEVLGTIAKMLIYGKVETILVVLNHFGRYDVFEVIKAENNS